MVYFEGRAYCNPVIKRTDAVVTRDQVRKEDRAHSSTCNHTALMTCPSDKKLKYDRDHWRSIFI